MFYSYVMKPKTVRDFVSNFKSKGLPLNLLINNAGVMNIPFAKTVDGFETTIAANYLGHFLLTMLLLDILKKSAPARIINLSSFVAKQGIRIDIQFAIMISSHYN